MATKKLKVELELETAKAKRQAKDLEQTVGGSDGGTGGSPAQGGNKLSSALDKAARSAEKSASAFDKMGGTAGRLTKGFAGIAIGMATSYAANYATGGTKTALDYGGAGISGAVGGAMMAGLPGAIVGGLAGVLKTYMEKDAERSAMSKDFETGEAVYAATRRDQQKFEELSTTKPGTDIAGNLAEAKKIIDNYTESAADFVRQIREELKKHEPDKEKLEKLKRNLDYSRAQTSKYEGLTKSLESIQEKQKDTRTSTSAYDSLGKIGGNFAGSFSSTPSVGEEAESSAASPVPSPGSGGKSLFFSVPVTKGESWEKRFGDIANGVETDPTIKAANEAIERIDSEQLQVLKTIAGLLDRKEKSTWQ